jgi:hypothetical protein
LEKVVLVPDEIKRHVIDVDKRFELYPNYPTHRHSAEFWEALGRAVATFGFLEETLGTAIYAMTATKVIDESDVQAEFDKWLSTLQKALSDPLGALIDTYGKSVRENQSSTISNLDDLLNDLREASQVRNILCHGSWRAPDAKGCSLPLFVKWDGKIFQTPIDVNYLTQVQRHVAELIFAIMNTITHMGYQFPGNIGPGKKI